VRAQLLAFFLFIFTIVGLGAGPAIVAGLTEYVFRREAMLGYSLAIVVFGGAVVALACFRLTLRHLAPAIVAQEVARG
jgi:hypothetical protein